MGTLTMGVSDEMAIENLREVEGSGSFRVRLIDSINAINTEQLMKRGVINE